MTEKMLLYELLGSSFLSSLFLEGNLFCVLLEGHCFQSFLWRMLKGKYKRETIKKHQDVVTEGCWLWPYVRYKQCFYGKMVGCMGCSVMFLMRVFTSFHSVKLKVVCRELGGFCLRLQLHFIWYLGRDSCKNY